MKKITLCEAPVLILFFLIFFSIVTVTGSFAQENDCITSKCHSNIDKDKYVHGPVAVGECLICHGSLPGHTRNPKKKKYKSITTVIKKCYICHESSHNKTTSMTAIKGKKCTFCHDPHGASHYLLLKE